MADEKPSVLIVGGLGYIGRFLALHIHKNDLASELRIVDKVLPQLAWLAPEFSEACSQERFMQADASKPGEFCSIQYSITLQTAWETGG
jgi:nucleoside-diphosphate-sugar epimerase